MDNKQPLQEFEAVRALSILPLLILHVEGFNFSAACIRFIMN